MKIFILEDDPRRMEYFNNTFNDYEIIWKKTAKEAIDFLKDNFNDMDYVFLDHDLGGKSFVSSSKENTGYTVALFISQNFDDFRKVIIHTMNPAGATNMKNILPFSQIIPFHELYERIVKV